MEKNNPRLIPNEQYVIEKADGPKNRRVFLLIFLIFLLFCYSWSNVTRHVRHVGDNSLYEPEQVHLSLGIGNGEYYVTWMTKEPGVCSLVWSRAGSTRQAEEDQYDEVLSIEPDKFGDEELTKPRKLKTTSYRAKMQVVPGAEYNYTISCHNKEGLGDKKSGDSQSSTHVRQYAWSFQFYATDYERENLNVIFFGDLGLKNAQSIPRLTQEVQSRSTNLIIHNGDFAYDLDTHHGEYGDRFMRLMEPIASVVPYQTSVGNHEVASNFSHYNYRFTMVNRGPDGKESMNNFYYSYNRGPIHFVAFSTEFYYFLSYAGIDPLVSQYNWLKEDLAKASSPEERAKRPWIIVYGHRPMYCSSRDRDDCSKDTNILRKGLPFTHGAFALEKLFYDYGVDVEIYAHEHQYERFLPIYDGQVFNGSQQEPYTNPRAPVHIISGSAGCQEKLDPFKGRGAPGSVKRIADYGYSRLKVVSTCELQFEQISDDQAGDVVDTFTLRKYRQNFPESKSHITYNNCPLP